MSWTFQYISTPAPSSASETAIVMIMAMVIVTFRHSPRKTSDRTYFARIGFLPVFQRLGKGQVSAVHAARLVADDLALVDLDHAAAHLVHDVGVVGDHDHRGAGAVDPVQQPHDLDAGVGVEVSG